MFPILHQQRVTNISLKCSILQYPGKLQSILRLLVKIFIVTIKQNKVDYIKIKIKVVEGGRFI